MITPYEPACLNINPLVPLAEVPSMFWHTHEGKAAMLEALLALILTGHKPQGLQTQMCGQRNNQRAFMERGTVWKPWTLKCWASGKLWVLELDHLGMGWIWKTAMEMDAKGYSQRGHEEINLSNLKNNKSFSADCLVISLLLSVFTKLNSCQHHSS